MSLLWHALTLADNFVKLKKELLKHFESVFKLWWVAQVHGVNKTHEQKASLCHIFAVIHHLFSLNDDWHMGRVEGLITVHNDF